MCDIDYIMRKYYSIYSNQLDKGGMHVESDRYLNDIIKLLKISDNEIIDASDRFGRMKEENLSRDYSGTSNVSNPLFNNPQGREPEWPKTQMQLRRIEKETEAGWRIGFENVVKAEDGRYYIPHSVEPISAMMKKGDPVSDDSLNRTIYWIVESVDDGNGVTWVKPTAENPFLTGVGAGGARFTQHDSDVLSGKYENERIQDIKDQMQSGKIDLSELQYILLGNIPLHFGPNGSQGGWYSSRSLSSNRGGRKGVSSPSDIVMLDAHTIQQLAREYNLPISVPVAALSDDMKPEDWDSYIAGNSLIDAENYIDDVDAYMNNYSRFYDFIEGDVLENRRHRLKLYNDINYINEYYNNKQQEVDEIISELSTLSPKEIELKHKKFINKNGLSNLSPNYLQNVKQEIEDDRNDRINMYNNRIRTKRLYDVEGEDSTDPESVRKMIYSRDKRVQRRNIKNLVNLAFQDPDKYIPDIVNFVNNDNVDYLAKEEALEKLSMFASGHPELINVLVNAAINAYDADNRSYSYSYIERNKNLLSDKNIEDLARHVAYSERDPRVINDALGYFHKVFPQLLSFIISSIEDRLDSIDKDGFNEIRFGEMISKIKRLKIIS